MPAFTLLSRGVVPNLHTRATWRPRCSCRPPSRPTSPSMATEVRDVGPSPAGRATKKRPPSWH